MKNNLKNLLLYEFKRMIFIFKICLSFIVLFDIISILLYSHSPIIIARNFDRVKEISLYIFMILQIVYLSFRTFADRNYFDYIHISPEKVFLSRLLLNFSLTVIFTLFLLLAGTSSFEIIKAFNSDKFTIFKNNLMFTFQGKNSWYIMFCVNNGFFTVLALCLLNVLQNIIFCKRTMIFKIIWFAIIVFLVYGIITIYKFNIVFPYALSFDYFKISVPLGYYDYNLFEHYKFMTDMHLYKEPIVFEFLFTVNILNILSMISTVIIVFLSFASNSFFTVKNRQSNSQILLNEFSGEKYYE